MGSRHTAPPRRRYARRWVAVLTAGLALAGCSPAGPAPSPATSTAGTLPAPTQFSGFGPSGSAGPARLPAGPWRTTLVASPSGSGSVCSRSASCAVTDALARADTITGGPVRVLLLPGRYPALTVPQATAGSAAPPLTIAGSDPATVSLEGIDVSRAHTYVDSLSLHGAGYLHSSATGSGLSRVKVEQGTVYLTAPDSYLTASSVTPAVDADGVQIKANDGVSPDGVLVQNTSIGPTSRGPKRAHVDCIQVMAGTGVQILNSMLFRCASQGVLVKSDAGGTVGPGLVLRNNVIQLCPERSDACDGVSAVRINEPGVTVSNNTILDGGLAFADPSTQVVGNAIAYLSDCGPAVTDNLIGDSGCTPSASNTIGQVKVADALSEPPDARLLTSHGSVGASIS